MTVAITVTDIKAALESHSCLRNHCELLLASPLSSCCLDYCCRCLSLSLLLRLSLFTACYCPYVFTDQGLLLCLPLLVFCLLLLLSPLLSFLRLK